MKYELRLFVRYATHWQGGYTLKRFMKTTIPQLLIDHKAIRVKQMQFMEGRCDFYHIELDEQTYKKFEESVAFNMQILHKDTERTYKLQPLTNTCFTWNEGVANK